MQTYYYLTALESSPFNLTLLDILHLGVNSDIPIYAFMDTPILMDCVETLERQLDDSMYLQVPFQTLAVIEKHIAKFQATEDRLAYKSEIVRSHPFNFAVVDDTRYSRMRPYKSPFSNESFFRLRLINLDESLDNYGAPAFVPAVRPPSISATDLICWTDDLEELAKQGQIRRRSTDSNKVCQASDDSRHITTSQELPHKFQQLYGAISGGELPDIEAVIDAWYSHWNQRAARGERDTYPKNPNIQAWLEDRGMSKNKAESIPPLIRPKWS